MHFSTLTLTAAVTACCLLSSAWSLPEPSRQPVPESSQQGLLTSGGPEVQSSTELPGKAAFLQGREPDQGRNHDTGDNRERFRVQKRSIKGKEDPQKDQLAKELMQDFADTPHPIPHMAVARCMAVRSSLRLRFAPLPTRERGGCLP
ncbi:MAG: hypothetical protein M1826_002581 [Phylliscum demangeonii]|nr:MAG: hypothetical protein M1826_002581 [Phylliscum demangeonii]